MTDSIGFWSYVHADDKADSGRISHLARDIVDQFEMLTGEKISLFLDKDALKWGEIWRKKIDSNLASIAFFIPVMTPRYFMRPECRRELQAFARRATDLGIKELILPLLYVDVAALHDELPMDDLIELVRTFQWEDWLDLRFLEVTSEGYRRGIARLATRLVEANRQAEKKIVANATQTDEMLDESVDDSLGTIDLLANFEEKLYKAPETLNAMTKDILLIGQIMQEAASDIQRGNSQGTGFAARLIRTQQLALQMGEPTEHIWSLSNEFASQLHGIDDGYRIIIERAPAEIKEYPDSEANFCAFFKSVRTLSASSNEALQAFQKMINISEPLERMSRDLRPVMRRLRQGLTIMIESIGVSNEWVQLIESSGVVCEDADVQI